MGKFSRELKKSGCTEIVVERFSSVGVSVASSVGYLLCNPLILRVSVGSVGVLELNTNFTKGHESG